MSSAEDAHAESAAQEDHWGLVTRVACKGNLLTRRRVHPHYELEGAYWGQRS
jgi:hypothetical protein